MSPGELIDQIREHYVSRLQSAIDEYRNQPDQRCAHEAAFCDEDGNVAVDGSLQLPVRGDLIVIRDDVVVESLQIDTEEMLSFEPIQFEWSGDLNVEMQPFQWNWLQLEITGLGPDADWETLRSWFLHWFQDEDPTDEMLLGVHFLSDPRMLSKTDSKTECEEQRIQLSVDMGTAPVDALEELLDALTQIGAKSVVIGQFEDEDHDDV